MALTKTGLTFVNGTTPAINATNLNAIIDLTDNIVDEINSPTNLAETTVTQEITDIPSTAIKGTLDSTLNGNTRVNIASDPVAGCESTSGWTTNNVTLTTDSSNELEGTNCLKATLTSGTGSFYRDILSTLDTTKYYLISIHFKNNDLSGSGIRLKVDCVSDVGVVASSFVTGTSYTRVGVVIQPTDFDTATEVRVEPQLSGVASEYAFIDALKWEEITSAEYSAGVAALLTKYNYHRGIKDSNYDRIKSVGLNLFNKSEIVQGYFYNSSGADTAEATSELSRQYIKVSPSTQYKPNKSVFIAEYDINKNFIQRVGEASTAITTTAATHFVRISHYQNGLGDLETFQFEKGSSSSTYEAYKESTAYVVPTLRSVPNGTQDEFDVNEGIHTKKISDQFTLDGDEGWGSYLNGQGASSNLSVAQLATFVTDNSLLDDLDDNNVCGIAISDGIYYVASRRSVATGYFIRTTGGGALEVGIPTAALGSDDLTGFTNFLAANPITAIFELATAETYNYYANTLIAEPSGTVFLENIKQEVGLYSSSIAIEDTNFPISSLAYVNKIDTDTGLLTPVPVSNCTVAADGLSFTVSTASSGDFYDFGYYYNFLSTIATMDYSYNTNLKAQVNSNTDEAVRLSKKVNTIDKIIPQKADLNDTNTFSGVNTFTQAPRHSQGTVIGANEAYIYESATNAIQIRTGASGSYKYFTFGANGSLIINNGVVSIVGDGANDTLIATQTAASAAISIQGKSSDNSGKFRFVNNAYTLELSRIEDDGSGNVNIQTSGSTGLTHNSTRILTNIAPTAVQVTQDFSSGRTNELTSANACSVISVSTNTITVQNSDLSGSTDHYVNSYLFGDDGVAYLITASTAKDGSNQSTLTLDQTCGISTSTRIVICSKTTLALGDTYRRVNFIIYANGSHTMREDSLTIFASDDGSINHTTGDNYYTNDFTTTASGTLSGVLLGATSANESNFVAARINGTNLEIFSYVIGLGISASYPCKMICEK